MKMYTRLLLLFAVLLFSNFKPALVQGTYEYRYKKTGYSKAEDAAFGIIKIHRLSSSAYLFYLEVGRGAPNYNSGATYGRLTLNKKTGSYRYVPKNTSDDCTLDIKVIGNKLTIKTMNGDCGYGYGVSADGSFIKKSKTNPAYFTDRHGSKIYFSKTTPERYLK